MNVHISYKIHKTPDIEREINHLLEKLNRRLRAFRPELVHLKGLIEQNSPREGAVVSLNLRLPSGQMAAQDSGANALAALKAASDDLVLQVKKHKDLLRSSHKWRRRGIVPPMSGEAVEGIEVLIQAGAVRSNVPPLQDIRSYVNTHLGRLERFIERELYFRETAGQMNSGSVAKEEVLDEVVVQALSETGEGPEGLALEPWLYRLAIQSINDLASRATQGISDVPLERSTRVPDVTASDETELEFHQPDEFVRQSDTIADTSTASPEDIAYTDELMSLVQLSLGNANSRDREVFVLHAIEGFSLMEIAAITDRKPEEIQSSIGAVREKLRHAAPIRNGFKEKYLRKTGTA